jgi:pyruvate,orthophosphate dikinase
MLAGLQSIHEGLVPVVIASGGCCARLAAYSRRFERALVALSGGDASMLASPLKDSYHTIWFEYHEELIELSGRDRATEET